MPRVYGSTTLNVAQFGREVTSGTPVAATRIWRGPFISPDDQRVRNIVTDEHVGTTVVAERTYDSGAGAQLAIAATPLTFEQFPHLCEMSIKAASPVQQTTKYVRTYDVPVNDTWNSIKTYTFRMGNKLVTTDVQIADYCFVTEWTAAGAFNEAWTMEATVLSRNLAAGALTGALSLEAVQEALFNKTTLYVDASGGTIGTTQVPGILTAAEVKYASNIMFVPVGDGNLYPVGHKFRRPEITFTLTVELAEDTGVSFVATERGNWRNSVTRLLQLTVAGSDANRALVFKGPVKWDKFGPYNDADGNTTVDIEGHFVYSPTDAISFSCVATNMIASYDA
jgi:hypothetical protein